MGLGHTPISTIGDQFVNTSVDYMPHVTSNLKHFDHLIHHAYPSADTAFVLNLRQSIIDGTWSNLGGLLEKAISTKGNLPRCDTVGMDFWDQSDAKLTTVRLRDRGRAYSAPVKNTHTKQGHLRVMCYEAIQDAFYYFLIPHSGYSHIPKTSNIEIPFSINGDAKRTNTCAINWWEYECSHFTDMCACLQLSK